MISLYYNKKVKLYVSLCKLYFLPDLVYILCIHGSASASYTRTRGQIFTPYPDVWISTIPGLKLACISTPPEVILLISTQTYISLPVCKAGQIPISRLQNSLLWDTIHYLCA